MNEFDTSRLFQNVGLTTLCHPITQTRYLIQLGHEPLAPVFKSASPLAKSLMFGTDCHTQPGLISQPSYITAAGLLDSANMTRGLGMSICETVVASLGKTLATKPLSVALPKQEQDDSFDQVMVDATREALINSTGIILANPFRIIAIRQIAGLADGSSKSVLESIKEGGLLAGLIPRLCYEFGTIFIVKTAMHMYKRHCAEMVGDDKKTKDTTESVVQLLVGHVTDLVLYPLKLVATCQAINGTGATLDAFPELGWLALLGELRASQQAMRGNSVTFARKVKAPVAVASAIEVVVETPTIVEIAPVVVETPVVAPIVAPIVAPVVPPIVAPVVEVLAEPLQQVVVEAEKPVEKSE